MREREGVSVVPARREKVVYLRCVRCGVVSLARVSGSELFCVRCRHLLKRSTFRKYVEYRRRVVNGIC